LRLALLCLLVACGKRAEAPPPPPPPAPAIDAAVIDAAMIDAAPWALGERPLPPDAGNEHPVMCTEAYQCREACDTGDGAGCYWLGIMYVTKSDVSMGVPFDPQQGLELLLRSCDAGITLGCNGAGKIIQLGNMGIPVDAPRALRLFDKGCALGMDAACSNAKRMRTPP
jgi:hypothetical protein